MSTHLICLKEDTPTQRHSVKHCITHIDDNGVPFHETSCNSLEEVMIPYAAHENASTDMASTKSINADESNINKEGCTTSNEALGPVSDFSCSSLPVHDKMPFRSGLWPEADNDGEQVGDVLSDTESDDIAVQEPRMPYTASEKYICTTQKCCSTELRIGYDDKIFRWREGSEISYVICEESFPKSGDAKSVETAMKQGIEMWQGIGITLKQVQRDDPATFSVVYGGHKEGTYAGSFFPHQRRKILDIYDLALSNAQYLPNILAHEIGHIYGLRHEFAPKREKEYPCVLLGSENAQSIMNYNDLSDLQVGQQDLTELKAFYKHNQRAYKELEVVILVPEQQHFDKISASLT